MFCVTCGRTIFSRIFAMGERSEIGRYDVPSSGFLFGFSIGTILASFQMWGIVLLFRDFSSRVLRYSSAMGPRCFRCFMLMLSGPVELLFLAVLMACLTCSVEMGTCVDCSFCVFSGFPCLLLISWG